MSDSTQKFILYARKSTDDLTRQVRSIDDQIAELSELAARENLQVIDILIEKETAKKPGRPIFNAMLERIEKGEASGILAWHPDRLARNSFDAGRIIYLVDTGTIKELKFPTFLFEPTSSGKFMLSIMLGYSKYYVDNLSENIKRGQRRKLKAGIWPKIAPLGYLNDRVARTIYPDPVKAPFIRKSFELYATGNYTLARLHDAVNALGLLGVKNKPLSISNYQYFLKNPIYYGLIRYQGEFYEAKHEPIIVKALFDKVQEVMARKSKPKTKTLKPYLYRGMFRCGECGGFMTIETQKGHNYLRCTKKLRVCSQPYVREEEVSRQVADYLRLFAYASTQADEMVAALEVEKQEHTEARKETIAGLRDKMRSIDERLARLMNAYLEEALSLEEYRQQKKQLVNDKRGVEDQIIALEKNRSSWLEPAIRFVKASKSAGFLADSGTDEEKRDFLKKVGSNLTISDRHLSVLPRGAWQLVVDQGRIAQHNAAAEISAAAFLGKSNQITTQRRGRESLNAYQAAQRICGKHRNNRTFCGFQEKSGKWPRT